MFSVGLTQHSVPPVALPVSTALAQERSHVVSSGFKIQERGSILPYSTSAVRGQHGPARVSTWLYSFFLVPQLPEKRVGSHVWVESDRKNPVKSAASVAQDGGQVEETCYTPKNYAEPMFL
jgi:hypothetical protein